MNDEIRKMPQTLKNRCFWDMDVDNMDIKANKNIIIARLYTRGDFEGIRWVHEHYTDDEIKEAAKKSRALNPIVANYLRQEYGLKREEMMYYVFRDMGAGEVWPY